MRTLLFTGASGFLGINNLQVFNKIYNVKTIGLTFEDDFIVNLVNVIPDFSECFDIVIHAAGNAHQYLKPKLKTKYFLM